MCLRDAADRFGYGQGGRGAESGADLYPCGESDCYWEGVDGACAGGSRHGGFQAVHVRAVEICEEARAGGRRGTRVPDLETGDGDTEGKLEGRERGGGWMGLRAQRRLQPLERRSRTRLVSLLLL